MNSAKWIKVLLVVAKYFQTTIGSILLLIIGWRVVENNLSPYTALVSIAILSIGGWVSSKKLDEITKYLGRRYIKENDENDK
jgi:hypothetical protein